MKFKRSLIMALPPGQSAFLWGARQTGKSTFLRENYADSYFINLLDTSLLLTYTKQPHLFRKHIEALPEDQKRLPIVVDEIQKIPLLLNEVHLLIESENIGFILCGSSARKLKQAGVNLLGGRAWRFEFFPLTTREIPNFDLLTALSRGLIPSHYLSEQYERNHRAYVTNFLRDEIQVESLVRDLPAFAKFLDMVGFTHGGMVNYSNIASDVGVSSHTVKEYYQILVDTLLGYQVYPYAKKVKRQIIGKMPKFYLFDVGIANHLARKRIEELAGSDAGQAFEHFILMEIIAYKGLNELDFEISYWRTKSGFEVDFILGRGHVAIEVKLSSSVKKAMLKGIDAFVDEHQPDHSVVVCQEIAPRIEKMSNGSDLFILPWQVFLDKLWAGEYAQ